MTDGSRKAIPAAFLANLGIAIPTATVIYLEPDRFTPERTGA